MKKQIDENIAVQISPTKNIESFQEKSALETLMSLIAEGKVNIPVVENNADFLVKLQTEIHTPAKNIELENQLKHIEAIKHEVEFSVKKTETEKKQLAAQKDAFLKRINNFKEENEKTKAELEEQRLELESKGKMLLQAQDEIAVKQQALETKEKLILENSDIDAKLESLAALKEDLRLESLKKLEEMREFKETKDQIKSELDDRVAMVEARERELEEKEMLLAQSRVKDNDLIQVVDAQTEYNLNLLDIYDQPIAEREKTENEKVRQFLKKIEKNNFSSFIEINKDFPNIKYIYDKIINNANYYEDYRKNIQADLIGFKVDELDNVAVNKKISEAKKELEKYNAEIDAKVLELVAIKQVQDGDVILDSYKKMQHSHEYMKEINEEARQIYTAMPLREKKLTELKNQIYKSPEYIQKSDASTQAFDPEFEVRAKNAMNTFYEQTAQSDKQLRLIAYRKKELGEIIKERPLYEYHGEVVDEATQYESTDNEIMDMLKTLAQINENSENPLSKEEFYNRISDMESKLIMSQLSAEYLDKSIVKKSHKLATLDQAFQARKYLDEHKTVESLRIEVVKDLMTKKIAPKFDAFLLREQNIGLDMQKSLFDAADQHIAQHHDQSDNQTNLLGQEVHNDF